MTHAPAPASGWSPGPARHSSGTVRPSAGPLPASCRRLEAQRRPPRPAEPHGSPAGRPQRGFRTRRVHRKPPGVPADRVPTALRQPPAATPRRQPCPLPPAPYAPDVLTDSVGPGQATVSRGVPQTDHAHRNGVCGFHGADPGRGAAHGRARLAAWTPAQGSVLPIQVRRGPTLSCLGSALGPVGETAPADSRVTRGMVTRTVTAHTRPQAPGTTRKAIDLEACRPTGRQTREGCEQRPERTRAQRARRRVSGAGPEGGGLPRGPARGPAEGRPSSV